MNILGIIWAVVIALKLFTTLVTASWWVVIFWPLIPIIAIFLITMIFGIGIAGFQVFRGR